MSLRGAKRLAGVAALAVALSACGGAPQAGTSPAPPNLPPGGSTSSSTSSGTSEEPTSSESEEPTGSSAVSEPTETREAGHPDFDNDGTSGTGDGAATTCSSQNLSGSFTLQEGAGSTSGWIHVSNKSAETCTLWGDYPGVTMTNRDAEPSEAQYYNNLAPTPANINLLPGETAAAEVRWSNSEPCTSIVWEVNVTVLPEDAPLALEPKKQDGGPTTFGLCGGGAVHVGGFQRA
ncbi:DUF4232 domain-containing protein [Saccharopolyspora taberi]|uniref:DUF4232 domain-containing protein n=1 Tax=Saccharopolyspora taberi TaxID=60895 RepID=A0ABN3VME6_9PSEU